MNSEPTEGAGFIEALTWLEVNKKRLAWGAAILLVVGFGVYVWSYMAESKEHEASDQLAALRMPLSAPTNQPPIPAGDFLKIAEKYPGTLAAPRAILLGATALFTEGKYSEAQA